VKNKEISLVELPAIDSPTIDPRSPFIVELSQRAQMQQSYNLNGEGMSIKNINMEKLNDEI